MRPWGIVAALSLVLIIGVAASKIEDGNYEGYRGRLEPDSAIIIPPNWSESSENLQNPQDISLQPSMTPPPCPPSSPPTQKINFQLFDETPPSQQLPLQLKSEEEPPPDEGSPSEEGGEAGEDESEAEEDAQEATEEADQEGEEVTVVPFRFDPILWAYTGRYDRVYVPPTESGEEYDLKLRLGFLGFFGALDRYLTYPEKRSLSQSYWVAINDFLYLEKFDYKVWYELTEEVAKEHELISMERETGLVPDIELPGESELKVSGRKMISMGYTKQNYPEYGYGEDIAGSDIKMDQELQLRVEGTIARKTMVNIDYDDTRENENRNRISVVYKGDPDEVVQEAAFGDIALSMPSTEFVSYGSSKSVFGGKVDLKVGRLRFMTIASREKGKVETENFIGSSEFTSQRINDTVYSRRRYFRTNSEYIFFSDHKIRTDAGGNPFLELFYYPGLGNIDGVTQYPITAYAYYDVDGWGSGEVHYTGQGTDYPEPGPDEYSVASDYFQKLYLNTDYTVNVESGAISLKSSLEQNHVLAVAYQVADENNDLLYSVGYDDNDNIVYSDMKLLQVEGLGGFYQQYKHYNVYYLGGQNIQSQTFLLKLYDTNGGEIDQATGKTYLQKFGLDNDDIPGIDSQFIDYEFGLLMFPDDSIDGRLPFDFNGNGWVEGPDAYQPDDSDHRYYFYVEFNAVRPSYILKPNIIPGSETVKINGVLQIRDQDYWIDYDSGFLEFFTDAINDPDARIEITYEYRPFFAELSKTLAGVRTELELNMESHIGATFIGEWTSKPARGEIPTIEGAPTIQNVVDADLRLVLHPDFMTMMADTVPLVRTLQPSNLTVEAEVARSYLNPNIVDKAKVDDMEGNKLTIGLPMREKAWMPSSLPINDDGHDEEDRVLLDVGELKILEYTIDDNLANDYVWTLQISGLPTDPDDNEGWGGIMRNISVQGMDFQEKRYKYLELLVKFPQDAGGLMHIDLGEISEDADSDSYLDTEDEDQDGKLGLDEDDGWQFNNGYIDVIIGADNDVLDTEDLNQNTVLDTSNNYFTYAIDIDEAVSDNPPEYVTRRMEDAYGKWTGWLTIRFPLEMESPSDEGSIGTPDPTKIKHIRVWFEAEYDGDFHSNDYIYIANIAPVGNRWYDALVDPVLGNNWAVIEDISNRNDDRYVPIKEEYDVDNNLKKESAISLKYILSNWEDIGWQGDDEGMSLSYLTSQLTDPEAAKRKLAESGMTLDQVLGIGDGAGDGILNTEDANHNGILDPGEDIGWGWPGTGEGNGVLDSEDHIEAYTKYVNQYLPDDYTQYHRITVRVYQAESEHNNEIFFLRFGSDNDNYYEYFIKVEDAPQDTEAPSGWKLASADIFHFLELQGRYAQELADNQTITEGNYRIKGTPQLINIVELIVGVRTTDPMICKEPGEVWINDILLEGADREEGWARRFKVVLDFADLISVGGYYRDVDGDFQSIGTLARSKQRENTKEVHSTLHLNKFMPLKWNVTMPLTGSWTKSVTFTEDRYDPQSSIYDYGTIISLTKKVDWSFKRKMLPSLSLGYSQSRSDYDRYSRISRTNTYSGTVGYDIPLRFPVMPTNVTANFKRSISRTTYTSEVVTDPDKNLVTDSLSTSMRFEPIKSFEIRPGFSYRLSWDRILDVEDYYSEGYSLQLSFSRKQGVRPTVSYSSTYSEDVVEGTDKLNVSNNTTITTSAPIDIGRLIGSDKSFFSSLSIAPTYSLTRSSRFDGVDERPDIRFRTGVDSQIEGLTPKTSRIRHSFGVSNKFRPLQFLAKRHGSQYSNWDCVSTTFALSLAHETVSTTGSTSRSRAVTFPDIDVRIDGTKNFPVFSDMLLRSTVVVGYRKRKINAFGISQSVSHNPRFSWRASWSDTFRTRFDLDYINMTTKEFDFGEVRKETTLNPSITINYDLKMPHGINIPVLGKIFRFRNELNFQGQISYTRTRTENSADDSYNRWDVSISAGYYITTNLHLTITTAYTKYHNLTQAGRDYSTISFYGTAEAVF